MTVEIGAAWQHVVLSVTVSHFLDTTSTTRDRQTMSNRAFKEQHLVVSGE